mgnify:CR=1 FL=1
MFTLGAEARRPRSSRANSVPGPVRAVALPPTVCRGWRRTSLVLGESGTSPVEVGAMSTALNSGAVPARPRSTSTPAWATSSASRASARSMTMRLIDGCRSYQLRLPSV